MLRDMPWWCLLFLCAWHSTLLSQADPSRRYFDQYSFEQGLNARQVREVVQSSNGFLWMATNEGLVRYDSKEFITLHDPAVPDHVSTNRYVETMAIDDRDRIWMAINEHVAIYDVRNDTWSYLGNELGEYNLFPLHFAFDSLTNMMWIGCARGLYHSADARQAYKHRFAVSRYDDRPYSSIAIDSRSNLWLINADGIFYADPSTGSMESRTLPLDTVGAKGFACSFLQGDSVLWVGGWGSGLVKHSIPGNTSQRYYYVDPSKGLNAVYAIQDAPDQQGVWYGCLWGMQYFNPVTNTSIPVKLQHTNDNVPEKLVVFSLAKDKSDAVLIGTEEGLFRFDPRKQDVRQIRMTDMSDCFPVDNLTCRQNRHNETETWLSVPYCGFRIYNHSTGVFSTWPVTLQRTLDNVGIFSFMMDSRDRLWIATNEKGLLVFDINADRLTSFSGQHFLQPTFWITNLMEDANDRIWIGTQRGLFRWNEKAQSPDAITAITTLIDSGTITPAVQDIAIDGQHVWLTTHYNDDKHGSLVHYDLQTKTATVLDRFSTFHFSGVHNFRHVECTQSGNVYVTTDKGLFAIHRGHLDSIVSFPEFAQSPGYSVDALAVDSTSGIWISANYGVSRFDETNNTMYSYTRSSSLIGANRLPGVLYSPSLKAVLLAQQDGFDMISTHSHANTATPHIYCLEVTVNGIAMDTSVNNRNAFRYRENDLAFHLAFPSYTNSANNVFRYVLEGYEDQWQTSSSGHIAYNNLPEGKYRFRAIGITGEGEISANEYTWAVVIWPPFYKTWWFQLGVISAVIGLITIFYRNREMQRRRLQQMRDSMARDLHDDIGSNLSAIRLLSEYELITHPDKIQPAMKTIHEKSNEVMDNMYDIIWTINPDKGRVDVMEKIRTYIVQTLEPQGIDIVFEDADVFQHALSTLTIAKQRELYLILKEAINNISKHAKASKVVFGFTRSNGLFVIELSDNGKGFDAELMAHRHGLGNMRSRAKALGSQIIIASSPGKGTVITLEIKAQ